MTNLIYWLALAPMVPCTAILLQMLHKCRYVSRKLSMAVVASLTLYFWAYLTSSPNDPRYPR